MDGRISQRQEVNDFIVKHRKFMDELKRLSLGNQEGTRAEMVRWQFKKTVEKDVDEAWNRLTAQEKKELASI